MKIFVLPHQCLQFCGDKVCTVDAVFVHADLVEHGNQDMGFLSDKNVDMILGMLCLPLSTFSEV